jgi:hypothetical protein
MGSALLMLHWQQQLSCLTATSQTDTFLTRPSTSWMRQQQRWAAAAAAAAVSNQQAESVG